MSICHGRGDKGFSLVEVMVSLVIFLITSMGLLPLLITNMQANQGNSLHAQARRLAGEIMAELQVVDYAGLAVIADEPLLVANIAIQKQVEQNLPQLDQSRITVTASWQQQGRTHAYQLQTIRSAP
ncbi:MAG: prepilin-type N-terminal cleavage/methylation domain-containing protein [Desulfuromonadales bacterium]|nr:prepilin-type N-terminal cleavage/methylation domain-containing protein [Desulfuromonadales bacterium]